MPKETSAVEESVGVAPSDELGALAAAARVVGEAKAVPDALRAQLTVLHELAKPRASFIALAEPDRGLLSVVCSRGRADPKVRAYALDEGVVGRAYASGGILEEAGPAPVLCVGLGRAGAPAGVACLISPKERPSDAALTGFAANLSAALEVAQLREEVRQRTQALADATTQMKTFDRQRDEFLGRVSHELKTPLTTVKTYLAMLLRGRMGAVGPEQHRALAICDRNSDRLLRLIDDLLLVSRLSVGQMNLGDKPFGLKALLEECWAASAKAAERARVQLMPISGGELFVRGDREHLREGLFVILDNAIRYNVPGGQVWGRLNSQGATTTVEIGDTGRGMSADKLAALFEPFGARSEVAVRRQDATNGLARAQQIVQLHGGSIAAQSVPDKGSVFTITLPLFAGMVGVAEAPHPEVPRTGAVLLVEDDDDCREGVTELLEAEGLTVASVASAEEAIAALGRSRPSLVLVDLRLRGGDGRSVIAHIRSSPVLASVPVFVMSGAVSEASRFSNEGPERIDGFFEKPLNLPRLLTRIRQALAQPSTT